MFTILGFVISFIIASISAIVLHGGARRFVRDRLRYVDAVQKGIAPWLAGGATFLLASFLVGILPIVGIGTAVVSALAVGTGVAAGAKDIRKGVSPVIWNS